ncbi:MAG: superoxide dismutase family protein [Candidatus Caldipriscus sp.]|nr:superoxide dismutase family protein [Candidatus Caldipriscus sp.]
MPSPYSILGRSVIIHMQHDDYMSQPAGNAGDRIACGIIGVVK